MKFHFIFLLLIDGSSFFLVFFRFSILSRIDNARREYLIENKARFSLFFVFIINISVISVKAGIISENIRCEISANVFFTDSVFESIFLAGEIVTTIYQCVMVTFLHNVLGKSFYSLCGCPSISVRPQRKYIFGMYFPFSCLIRLQLIFSSFDALLARKTVVPSNGEILVRHVRRIFATGFF